MCVNQAGVLGIHLCQVSLPNCQARQVQTTQVAPKQPQQIDKVARRIPLLRWRSTTPAVHQRQKPLRCSTFPALGGQLLHDWCADEPLLGLPQVVSGLRLDQRLLAHNHGLTTLELVESLRHQPVGHIFEHHRL